MEDYKKTYLKKWDERSTLLRREYSFEKYSLRGNREEIKLRELWGSLKSDVLFVFRQLYAIAKQLKVFGPSVKNEYGLSFYLQVYRMLYLVLVVKTNIYHFRKRLLFKEKSWKNVRFYDYGQIHTQLYLAKCSFPNEISVIEDKFEFFRFCKEKSINTPEILAVFSYQKQLYPDTLNYELPKEDLFIKDRNGGRGINARKFTYQHGVYRDTDQNKFNKHDILELIGNYSQKRDVIIQKTLVNHVLFKPFTSGSLATCRVVTVKMPDHNNVKPLFAVFRMPAGSKDVDNYAQGGLLSTVNISTGKLGRAVTYIPYQGKFEFEQHPDTKQQISGVQLPLWDKILDFTIESHKNFRSLAVGWDVCAAEDGLYLIEGNIRWGSSLYECPEQLPFRETEYPKIYEELIAKYTGYE